MSARACRHTQPQKLGGNAARSKTRTAAETNGRDYEQIHRRNAIGMIEQKGLPALRRRLPSPHHVFCHGGLPDIDTELGQFAVDPRGSHSGFAMLMSRMRPKENYGFR